MRTTYVPLLRRRRTGVTNYRARRKAITSHKALLVIRISNKNAVAQFVRPGARGDLVLSSAHSKELERLGWHGSRKSTPACYLLGLLAGSKAARAGVKEAIAYNGVVPFIGGSRIAALLKGVSEAGVSVPVGEEAYPDDARLKGKTIADYASKLSSEDKEAYSRTFSRLNKEGFRPENYPSETERVKSAITKGSK